MSVYAYIRLYLLYILTLAKSVDRENFVDKVGGTEFQIQLLSTKRLTGKNPEQAWGDLFDY